MKQITIRQIDLENGLKHVALHRTRIPEVGESGFYRTAVALNAFFYSKKRRNKVDGFLYLVVDDQFQPSAYEQERDAELPVYDHASLKDFFSHIGFQSKPSKKTPVSVKLASHFRGGLPDLIHCAFRYYLGRRTIATCAFASELAHAWQDLADASPRTAGMIARELEREFEADDLARVEGLRVKPLGDDCDREAWEHVREVCAG